MIPSRLYRLATIAVVLIGISLACNFRLSDTGFVEPAAQRDTEEASFNSFAQTEDARCAGLTDEECVDLDIVEIESGSTATEEAPSSAITEEGPCAGLTGEECAVEGTHEYVRSIASCAERCGSFEGPLTHEIIFDGDTITVINAELGWEVTYTRTDNPNQYARDGYIFLTIMPDGLLWENYGADDGSLAFSYWDALQ